MISALRAVLAGALLMWLGGCAPSEEEIQQEFEEYVADASSCEEDDECAIAGAGCPLGCWVAVRSDRVDDVERKARDLIADYESAGRACDYGCAAPGEAVCVDGRCTAEASGL